MKKIDGIQEFIALVKESGSDLSGSLLNLETGKLELSCDLDSHMVVSDGLYSPAIEDGMCILSAAVNVMGEGKYKPVLIINYDNEIYYCEEYMYRAIVDDNTYDDWNGAHPVGQS